MAKNLLKGMAALAICAAFASCSHDTDFEAANQEFTVENLKNEYKAAFVQKYGEVAPNQSWDFTGHSFKATRGENDQNEQNAPSMTWYQYGYGGTENNKYILSLRGDFVEVKDKVLSEDEKPQPFPYTYSSIILRPAFAHGYTKDYNYYY